jgi:predicted nucleotidyltransferase
MNESEFWKSAASRDQVISILSLHAAELRHRGVTHAAIFGSVARGEATDDSDIDILVELDPEAPISVFDYVGIKQYIAGLFHKRVDVVNRDALKNGIHPSVMKDARYAF